MMWKYLACLFGIVLVQHCTGYVLKGQKLKQATENQPRNQVAQPYSQNDGRSKSANQNGLDNDDRENEEKDYPMSAKQNYFNQDMTASYTLPWSVFARKQPPGYIQAASSSTENTSDQNSSTSSSGQKSSSPSSDQNTLSSSSGQNPSSSSSDQSSLSSTSDKNPSSSNSDQNPSSSNLGQNPSSSSSSQKSSSSSSSQGQKTSSSSNQRQNPSSTSGSNPSSSNSSPNGSTSSSGQKSSSLNSILHPILSPNRFYFKSSVAMPNEQRVFDYWSNFDLKIARPDFIQSKYQPWKMPFNMFRSF
ncbi:hypothetical protein ACF0H5_002199 [Mactra antiquata]